MKKQHKWHKEIKAWADGAEIEVRQFDMRTLNWLDWKLITTNAPRWSTASDVEYRIKPQPELVPFDFSDAEQLIGKVVKAKEGGTIRIITCSFRDGMFLGGISWVTNYMQLFELYTFLDGSPCGKYVNE